MSLKKITKITLGIFIPIGIIWGGYYLWQTVVAEPNAPPEPITELQTTLPSDSPAAPTFSALTNNAVFDYWINSVTGAIYYLDPSGQVIRKFGAEEEVVNSQTLNKLNSVLASPDGTFAIAKFNYPNFPTFSIFNTVTNSWESLPENTLAVAWANNSQQLAYVARKNNSGSLRILNIVSQRTREVLKLDQQEVQLQWVKPSEIFLLTSAPTINYTSSLWSIDLKAKTLQLLIPEEFGLTINWSPEGDLGLKLNDFQNASKFSLIDNLGNTLKQFSFVTLPEKCVFENRTIYCGVPQFIGEGVSLPDDYYKKAVYFRDDVFAIDLDTGESALLLNGDEQLIDARHLTIHDNQLIFINRYDDRLYSLQL